MTSTQDPRDAAGRKLYTTPKPITVDVQIGRDEVVTVTATPVERGDAGWSYDVTDADGTKLGTVAKRMITREREIPGKRYVASRWQSPGWQYSVGRSYRWFEVHSMRYGVERVAREARS